MAKKVSKWFRIGVEGDTCDGRVISATDIQEMADSYDPRVYGCRINLEHLRGLLPDSVFKRYGDVAELKAEVIDDDSALNGKLALFAKITPTDDLVAMNKAGQKVYTSMEFNRTLPTAANAIWLVWPSLTTRQASVLNILSFAVPRNTTHSTDLKPALRISSQWQPLPSWNSKTCPTPC